jgi:hypothetical protein
LIKKVPPDAERKTFMSIAQQIFDDGVFNWGRVVALFYFAYKVCIKVLLLASFFSYTVTCRGWVGTGYIVINVVIFCNYSSHI